jgi:DNA-binding IclR family transcriptional regulator
MSSFSRILAILDLFTETRPIWHSDDIMAALNYSRPTAYRYIKDLAAAGYLQRVAAARYALGPRLIELDYLVRNSDPVLIAAMPAMDDLARQAGLDAVLTAMFDDRVIDIHRVQSDSTLRLVFGRGRRRPLFFGASPKMIMAHLSRAEAVKLYRAHAPEIARLGLGAAWPEFRDQLSAWRKAGVYVSLGEVEAGACAMAAPILNPMREVVAALALVAAPDRFDTTRLDEMRLHLVEACRRIELALAQSSCEPSDSA